MNPLKIALTCSLGLPLLAAGGSCEPCPATLVSQEQLVAEYNANAAMVPRLWARAKVQVKFVDAKGRAFTWGSTLLPPNALLHLRKGAGRLGPHDFLLHGREAGQEVFRAGVSTADGVYYFWTHYGGEGGGLYGRNALAGAAGVEQMPIDPHQLLSVLGITELPADFTQPPTVLMRMDDRPQHCAYVLTYIDRQPITGKIVSRREAYFDWHDRRPRRPFQINFFDEHGRSVMIATMKAYKPITAEDVDNPPAAPAEMPTDIKITWPQKGSEIHIVLSEMTTADLVDPELFKFWDRLPGAVRSNLTCVDSHLKVAEGATK